MTHKQDRRGVEQWPGALKDMNFDQSRNLWARVGWDRGLGRLAWQRYLCQGSFSGFPPEDQGRSPWLRALGHHLPGQEGKDKPMRQKGDLNVSFFKCFH